MADELYSFDYNLKAETSAALVRAYGLEEFKQRYYHPGIREDLERFYNDPRPVGEVIREFEENLLQEERGWRTQEATRTEEENNAHRREVSEKKNDFYRAAVLCQNKDRVMNLLSTFSQVKDQMQGDEQLRRNFEFIYSLSEFNHDNAAYREDGDKNVNRIKVDQDGKLRFVMKNLGGTGLSFSIEDGRSIVLARDQRLTATQVAELSRFFYMNGLSDIADFNFANLQNVEIVPDAENSQGKDFNTLFSEGLDAAAASEGNVPNNGDEFLQGLNGPSENGNEGFEGEPKAETKDYVFNMRAMTGKVKARLGLMGYTKPELITTRRCMDGSIVICAYTTETDLKHDSETKNGDVNRKKAFAVKVGRKKTKNGQVIPCASWYLPDGKVLETGHCQCMIEALKTQGCEYIKIPGGVLTGGKGQGAFWEAFGKTLMVPLAMSKDFPDGADIANEHVVAMLEQAKKENKHDSVALIKWKKKLLEELKEQEAYKKEKNDKPILEKFERDYNEQKYFAEYGQLFEDEIAEGTYPGPKTKENFKKFAKEQYLLANGGYKTNSLLNTQIATIEGSIIYDDFKSKHLPRLTQYIMDGISGKYNEGFEGKWDPVETAAAYRALGEVIQEYASDQHDPRNPNKEYTLLLKKFREKAEKKKTEVAKEIYKHMEAGIEGQERPDIGRARNDAVKSLQEGTTKSIEAILGQINEDYGIEMKFTVARARNPYIEKKYFYNRDDVRDGVVGADLQPVQSGQLKPMPPTPGITPQRTERRDDAARMQDNVSQVRNAAGRQLNAQVRDFMQQNRQRA